jgi:selenocysteine lyase/cysteine desulfurase
LFSVDQLAPRLDGSLGPYINFDNAASTPPLKAVEAAIQAFMPWYSSVHRGNGYKSRLATHAYDRAREITLGFVGGDPRTHVCIFGKNTTEATNKLARRFPFRPGRDVVLVSMMEHHSNDLPYRAVANVVHVRLTTTGELDEARLRPEAGRVRRPRGAGGHLRRQQRQRLYQPLSPPGGERRTPPAAQILVDCAQLSPHRAGGDGGAGRPGPFRLCGHFRATSCMRPYGTGRTSSGGATTFEQGRTRPARRGHGGDRDGKYGDWSAPPDREEAGSPNVVGGRRPWRPAIQQLQAVGMETVAAHEAELTRHTLRGLARMDGGGKCWAAGIMTERPSAWALSPSI